MGAAAERHVVTGNDQVAGFNGRDYCFQRVALEGQQLTQNLLVLALKCNYFMYTLTNLVGSIF